MQVFGYDDLYRLVSSEGTYSASPDQTDRYRVALSYDTIHNLLRKDQAHDVTNAGGSTIPQQKTSYDWKYAYTGAQPHAPTLIGERAYSYDANGNQTGWEHVRNGTRRSIRWDEENRIQAVRDGGQVIR